MKWIHISKKLNFPFLKRGAFLFIIAEIEPIWYTYYKVRILYVKKETKNETRKNFRQIF